MSVSSKNDSTSIYWRLRARNSRVTWSVAWRAVEYVSKNRKVLKVQTELNNEGNKKRTLIH